jgi:hypothetical protein
MRRVFERILRVAALTLVAGLAGCSAGQIIDRLPGDFGLPAGAPARPEKPHEYPAVHDMPPARAAVPMTEEEQVKAEKELTALRDRQEGRSPASKKATAAAKKPQTAVQNGQTTGTKPNP